MYDSEVVLPWEHYFRTSGLAYDMKELNRMLGIETRLSIAFHLQTDGQTEQMNQELEQYL